MPLRNFARTIIMNNGIKQKKVLKNYKDLISKRVETLTKTHSRHLAWTMSKCSKNIWNCNPNAATIQQNDGNGSPVMNNM